MLQWKIGFLVILAVIFCSEIAGPKPLGTTLGKNQFLKVEENDGDVILTDFSSS